MHSLFKMSLCWYSSDGYGTPCRKLLVCAITITTILTKRHFEQGVHNKELIMIGSLFVQGVVLLLLPFVTTVTPCWKTVTIGFYFINSYLVFCFEIFLKNFLLEANRRNFLPKTQPQLSNLVIPLHWGWITKQKGVWLLYVCRNVLRKCRSRKSIVFIFKNFEIYLTKKACRSKVISLPCTKMYWNMS